VEASEVALRWMGVICC